VTSVGGTTWMAANLALQNFGLEPGRDDVKINAIGNQGILIQAIDAGSVDMAIVDPFFSRRLKQKGYKIMLELHRSNIPFITTSVVTRQITYATTKITSKDSCALFSKRRPLLANRKTNRRCCEPSR